MRTAREGLLEMDTIFDFRGKVALVTGSGRGIGRGIALGFARSGATLALHCRKSRAPAEALAAEIRGAGGSAQIFQADLTEEGQVAALFDEIRRAYGGVDVLVNNAGEYPSSPLLEVSAAEWDRVIDVNLRSVFLATQAAARQMVAAGRGGVVINIASIEAIFPASGHSHYAAAKAGVVMLTRSAALELGRHGIRVNAVLPGLIGREGIERDWPEGVESWKRSAPLGRLGTPEDVVQACLFLASPAAAWITGVALPVDGGVSCRPAF